MHDGLVELSHDLAKNLPERLSMELVLFQRSAPRECSTQVCEKENALKIDSEVMRDTWVLRTEDKLSEESSASAQLPVTLVELRLWLRRAIAPPGL